MSKGLKALEHIKECPIYDLYQDSNSPDPSYTSLIKKEPYLAPYFRDVEKELKALEIIKSKPWLVNDVVESKGNYDVYKSWCNTFRADMKYRASEEEYNLLKEVLL